MEIEEGFSTCGSLDCCKNPECELCHGTGWLLPNCAYEEKTKMKTILNIEIESPDNMEGFFPEEGDTEEDYEENKEDLVAFRKRYAEDIHNFIKQSIKDYIEKDDELELRFLESDCACENLDTLKEYGIKIALSEKKCEP
jgi:hypothetical protein